MQQGQLEAFLCVARLGSIARAAEEMFVVQSSLSERLQVLEDELGAKLLLRSRRGTVLTQAGQHFLPFARAALQAMEEGKRKLADVRSGYFTELEIAATPTISTYLLPQIVNTLALSHPGIRVQIHTGRPDDILQWVINGQAQVGLSENTVHPQIQSQPIILEKLVLISSPAHPFAISGKTTIRELGRIGLICYGQRSTYYELTCSLFQAAQLTPRFSHEVNNIEVIKRLVRLNLGVAIVPLAAVEEDLRSGCLVHVEITDAPAIERNICLIQRVDVVPSEMVTQFIRAASEVNPQSINKTVAMQKH